MTEGIVVVQSVKLSEEWVLLWPIQSDSNLEFNQIVLEFG